MDRLSLVLALARRYLTGAQSSLLRGTSLSALGSIGLGVTAMVVAMALMTGYTEELQRKLLKIGAVQVTPQVYGGFGEDDLGPGDPRPGDLLDFEEVSSVHRVVYSQGSLASPTNETGTDVMIRGVEPGNGEFAGTVADLAVDERGRPGVLLGPELARQMKATIGDTLKLVAVSLEDRGPRFRYKAVRYAGTFETGFWEFDSSYVLLSTDAVSEVGGTVVIYELELEKFNQAEVVREKAQALLGDNYLVSDWLRQNPQLFTALRLQTIGLFVMLGLIVVVSTFNVASTLVVLVREKMRDVGVLGAMGLRPRQIERIFLLIGGLLGALGTAVGLVVGSLLAWVLTTYRVIRFGSGVAKVYFIDYVPFEVRPAHLLAITAFSLTVTLLASWLPARGASSVSPSAALRYE